jgi:hypothetical protein
MTLIQMLVQRFLDPESGPQPQWSQQSLADLHDFAAWVDLFLQDHPLVKADIRFDGAGELTFRGPAGEFAVDVGTEEDALAEDPTSDFLAQDRGTAERTVKDPETPLNVL